MQRFKGSKLRWHLIKHQNKNLENFQPWQCYIEVIQYKQILKSSYSILQKNIKVLHAKVVFFFIFLDENKRN